MSEQVKEHLSRASNKPEAIENPRLISTGSTLLDLAISGGRFERGGVPGGILVEIFGPSSCGKTVLLCEMAGGVQRTGGMVRFNDPEGRLNSQFATLFGFKVEDAVYSRPDTVPQLFEPIISWEPEVKDGVVNAVFADSLASLSTDLEMDKGDKMGQRRAKEFSEECRKVCRVIANRGILVVCSNQVRQNIDPNPWAEKFTTPGGMAVGFYASLRLRCRPAQKLYLKKDIAGKEQKRVIGVETEVEVYKNSIWEPFRIAPVIISYAYGIDDLRANLGYLKESTGAPSYILGERKLGVALERAIKIVEEEGLENELRDKVVEVWNDIEKRFTSKREPKRRI
jgi:protein RecA